MRQGRPVNPASDRPVYKQVADDLRQQITDGDLEPDEKLPGEARLGHMYGVGTNTIRSALDLLRGEGLIVTAKGRGSRIAAAMERTLVIIPVGADFYCRPATDTEREELGLADHEPVLVIEHRGETLVLPAYRVRGHVPAAED